MKTTTVAKILLPVIMIIGFFANIIFNSPFISLMIFCVFCMDLVYIMKYDGGFFKGKNKDKEK